MQRKIKRPFFDFSIDEYFQDDSYIEYHTNGHCVVYDKGLFSLHSSMWMKEDIEKYIAYCDAKLKHKGEMPKDEQIDEVSQAVLDANARMILYILAERNLVGNLSEAIASLWRADVPLSKPLLEYMSWFENARHKLVPYNVPVFGVRFVKKNGTYRIELTDKEKDLPLKACSSGLQSAIPMLMIIDYALQTDSFNSFVIEEPAESI